ncbi:alpha-L-fucosidase [Niabella drilacis]|uniref:alpha-L-fucosidase n=1 Tax=Niabella drilacis (strain DSM 25811 / CCM 8410 / CCUG 62505 / LMG 26954 / E90) TaxID=1285928 RepID=A0A1G6TUA2_NIADE|nr:alpha-L-fucosidase [Niabella drilacis]SDD32660.1 Alpha-L-fucosidase [Niabella drilacis]
MVYFAVLKERFIKACFTLLGILIPNSIFAQSVPLPNAAQVAWQEAELGVVFHYDLHVFDTAKYEQAVNRIKPVPDYNIFKPGKLDVEQWVLAAKSAGAKFAMITATHETGFALYQSDVNPYCMKALNWKGGRGDLVKDFVAACRKHGIKPGVYIGIRWNSLLGVHDFKIEGSGAMQKERQAYYNQMVEGMVTEICTRYGPLFEIWFDGGASSPDKGAPDVLPIVKKYQPGCLFYHNDQLAEARWGGSETGTVPYPCWSTFPYNHTGSGESAIPGISKNDYALLKEGDMNGKYYMPAMADAPLRGYGGRHEWFWEPGDEKHIYPLKDLVDMYYHSVGRNATLILGLTPDNTGLLPEPDVQRLKEFGAAIRKRFDKPVAASKGSGSTIQLVWPVAKPVNQLVIQEAIENGQRVKRFSVEAWVNGKWVKQVAGTAIGNKFIYVLKQPVITSRLRLNIEAAFDKPIIKNFSAYSF